MRYHEYLQCARKHLDSCVELFNSYNANQANRQNELSVFLELYYLLGYVIEGFTIYSVYKINNWPSSVDIKNWDRDRHNNNRFVKNQIQDFIRNTGLDFYKDRKTIDPNTNSYTSTSVFPQGIVRYFVESHKYQYIVCNLLSPSPAFNNFPYFGNGQLDTNIRNLIHDWDPKIRYYYPARLLQSNLTLKNNLTESNISLLIDTCKDIIINRAHQI